MIDLHLRADTAEILAGACPWLTGTDEQGALTWRLGGEGWAFDPVGSMVTTPGTYDEAGAELTPPVIDARFHANLRCTDEAVAELVPAELLVSPETPGRVWA